MKSIGLSIKPKNTKPEHKICVILGWVWC